MPAVPAPDPRDALALANRPLAVFLVRRLAPPHLRFDDDLVQAALLGLVLAARAYDPTRAPFATFAGPYVRRQVLLELHARDLVAIPEYLTGEQRAGARRRPVRLAEESPSREGAPDEAAGRADLAAAVRGAVAGLPERQALVLALRMDGLTLCEVGRRLAVTAERARQIEAEALAALRERRPGLAELLE